MRTTLMAITPIVALAGAVMAAPAAAQNLDEDVTIRITTQDLDLTNVDDLQRLETRVERAIERACRSGGRDLASRRTEAACRAVLADTIAPSVSLAITDANTRLLAALGSAPEA